MSEHQKSASTRGKNITNGIFSFVILILFLPQIILLATAPPAGWDGLLIALLLNLFTTMMLVTRPLTNLKNLSMAGAVPALQLFQQAMPDAEGWLNVTYPQTGGIANYLTVNALNIYVFILPVLLLLWGAIRAGTYAKKDESGIGVGLKFAAKLTLGNFAAYAIVWGVLGAVAGTWGTSLGDNSWLAPFIIFWFLLVSSWPDLIFIFAMSAILSAAGKVIGKKKAQKSTQVLQKKAQMAEAQASLLVPAPRVAQEASAIEAEERYVVQNFCELCGTKLEQRGIYCPGCGAQVRKEVPQPVEVPVPKQLPSTEVPIIEIAETRSGIPKTIIPEVISVKEAKRQKQLQNLENGILSLNRVSTTWAIVFTILSIVTGGINSGVQANAYPVLAAIFTVPFGIFAAYRDQQVFQGKIWKKNYSSRGIDMILVGLMGNLASGAGLLILIKGVMMLGYTSLKKEEYPKLTPEQWEARIYQEVNVYGAPLMALTTISVAAEFALDPFLTGWIIVKIFLGAAVYFAYTNYVKQDLVKGNFFNAEEKCLILGIIGCIVNGGGILILIQGIILYLHRIKKLELAKKQAAEKAAINPEFK